jgi:2-polyprenyl-6-methoxyphenol hydroxylase-like FAD-dependent oxidoreductase
MATKSVRKQQPKAVKASATKQQPRTAVVRKQQPRTAVVRKQVPKAGAARVSEPRLKAAVLGGSIAGLTASLVLHKKGYEVTLYEKYKKYTRSIQWTVRQSFIDYLYSVDKDMAKDLFTVEKLVSPITNGYRYLSDKTLRFPDGAYLYKSRDGQLRTEAPDPKDRAKSNESCAAALAEDFVGIIRARDLEVYLLEYIRTKTKIIVDRNEAPKCVRYRAGYALLKGAKKVPYDLIVVCVGSGKSRKEFLQAGKVRDEFPAKFNPVSRQRAQVCGDVELERHGMVTQYQHAKPDKKYLPYLPDGELLYSTLLSTDQDRTTCWVIGDVSTDLLSNAAEEPDKDKRNELAKRECGTIAARTMLESEKEVREAVINGVVDDTVKMFVSQAKLSSAAFAGDNIVLAGDAVGAGHWAVGGGMHVAGVCHQKRLETLATDLKKIDRLNKTERNTSLEKYSKDVLEDTKAWISKSMQFYYLSIPKRVVEAVFENVMEDYEKDKSINFPQQMQERIISAYFGLKYDMDLKKLFPDEP